MDLGKLESEALHLTPKERIELIRRLVLSIDSPSEEELKAEWLAEAQRRAAELDDQSVQTIAGEDVMARARQLLR